MKPELGDMVECVDRFYGKKVTGIVVARRPSGSFLVGANMKNHNRDYFHDGNGWCKQTRSFRWYKPHNTKMIG